MESSLRIRLTIIGRRQARLRLLRRRRQLRDASNPFSISDTRFQELFRFPKHLAKDFIDEVSVYLNDRHKLHGIPRILRILTAVRFYATGKN